MFTVKYPKEMFILTRLYLKLLFNANAKKTIKKYEQLFLDEKITGGLFVSLYTKSDKQLRGCIGELKLLKEPFLDVLKRCTVAAATADYRFEPLEYKDLDNITVEITILSTLFKVDSLEDIEIGKDGLYLEYRAGIRAVLLPQVAVEYGMDQLQFLKALYQKAGLDINAVISPLNYVSKFKGVVYKQQDYI